MLDGLLVGFGVALDPINLLYVFVGVVVGTAIGEDYVPAEYQTAEDFDGFLAEAEEVYTRILGS